VVLEPQPGRTADEAVAALSRPFPAEAARLDQAATTFDAVRYGNRTAHGSDYEAMTRLDLDIEAARPTRHDAGLDTAALP
jgi:hypothetical protein